jgi:DNA-binding response OmpR family regulator
MPKIAIIDDDPDIIEATTILLEGKGYQTVSAYNIEEARAIVNKENPDLIILDVMLEEPDDGFYLANRFRKDGVKQPIIMLTSVSKTLGFTYGSSDVIPVDEFLEKPVTPSLLLERIEFHLEKK